MIVVVLCVKLSIVFKLKSIKIREFRIPFDRTKNRITVNTIVLIGWAAINIIINVT